MGIVQSTCGISYPPTLGSVKNWVDSMKPYATAKFAKHAENAIGFGDAVSSLSAVLFVRNTIHKA